MEGEYETPEPDLTLYHDYLEPIYEDDRDVTSQSRDSQYEHLSPDGRSAPGDYTPLGSLTATAPPAYEPLQPGLSALSTTSCVSSIVSSLCCLT